MTTPLDLTKFEGTVMLALVQRHLDHLREEGVAADKLQYIAALERKLDAIYGVAPEIADARIDDPNDLSELRHVLRLAEGHSLPAPGRPVYWAVQFLDRETGKVYTMRSTTKKHERPKTALNEVYGNGAPTNAMIFHNLGTRVEDARKALRAIAQTVAPR